MVPDNYDRWKLHEGNYETSEAYDSKQDFISWIVGEIHDIIEGVEDEEVSEKLYCLIGKLEGER